jgi:hypothetical protein
MDTPFGASHDDCHSQRILIWQHRAEVAHRATGARDIAQVPNVFRAETLQQIGDDGFRIKVSELYSTEDSKGRAVCAARPLDQN